MCFLFYFSLLNFLLNIICNAVNIIAKHSITPVMFQTQCFFSYSLSFCPGRQYALNPQHTLRCTDEPLETAQTMAVGEMT